MDRDWEGRAAQMTTTYRYLRLAMPVLALMLAASVAIQVFSPTENCWLGSISAYYYTSARGVFVATLCCIGTCLFVYKGGSDREDAALNVSGALAFLVAFIPTPLAGVMDGPEPVCKRSNVPTPEQLRAALDNNVWAALVGGIVVALAYVVLRRTLPDGPGPGRPRLTTVVGTCSAVALCVVLYVGWPEEVIAHGHGVSAILLFVGVIAMVLFNAFPTLAGQPHDATSPAFRTLYLGVLAAMGVAAVAIGVPLVAGVWDNGLFWLEGSLIASFATFWVLQTIEHWTPGTSGPAQDDGRRTSTPASQAPSTS